MRDYYTIAYCDNLGFHKGYDVYISVFVECNTTHGRRRHCMQGRWMLDDYDPERAWSQVLRAYKMTKTKAQQWRLWVNIGQALQAWAGKTRQKYADIADRSLLVSWAVEEPDHG